MNTTLVVSRRDALAVVYLHSGAFEEASNRLLLCSLQHLYTYIAQNTSLVVYVFYAEQSPPTEQVLDHAVTRCLGIHWIPLERDYWSIPKEAERRRRYFTLPRYSDDYRLMGHWRLTFPFEYVRALGHRYLHFMDDDSIVLSSLNYSIVRMFDEKGYNLGYINLREDVIPCIALPELARYYITRYSVDFDSTMLRNDTKSMHLNGLYSGGWRCTVMHGNFVTISLDFWFRNDVQLFLRLALLTGDHIVHRWNEQLVIGMIRLLFNHPDREMRYQLRYDHNKDPDAYCSGERLDSTVDVSIVLLYVVLIILLVLFMNKYRF